MDQPFRIEATSCQNHFKVLYTAGALFIVLFVMHEEMDHGLVIKYICLKLESSKNRVWKDVV